METVLEYIMLNYTWFLGGAIIILLAIIGSYADKTNFGQGKTKEQEINLEEVQETNEEQMEETVAEVEPIIEIEEEIIEQPETSVEKIEKFEETFEKLDKEFNELLPEKEIIDDDLLEEIDSLSLDKTQKLKLTDIPDLDDVELPKIKSMPKEEDIWKF